MPAMDPEILDRWRTLQIVDRDGGTVGNISEFYLDLETRYPTWALVNTGLFGARQSFVPLLEATEVSDGLKVPYEKGHIKDAPHIDPRGELTPDEEATLCAHYGIDYRPAGEATADEATAGEAAAEATADEATAGEPFADEAIAGEPAPAEPAPAVAGTARPGPAPAEPEPAPDDQARDEPTLATPHQWGEPGEGEPAAPDRQAEDEPAPAEGDPRTVPVAGEVAWPASPPPPGPLAEPPAQPPAASDAERPREPDEAAAADEEPSMLERARRRFEGFVSGGGPATPDDRDARDR
jgi:PRC-barrel domain